MQKQIKGLLLCGVLFFSSINLVGPAMGATKCMHVGDTQTIAGKSQACKKLNGKLVWVKVTKSMVVTKKPSAVAKSWVEYVACMDSYKSSPLGSAWASTFCAKYDPHGNRPIKSWAEYNACQQFSEENLTFGMFEDCSPWHP